MKNEIIWGRSVVKFEDQIHNSELSELEENVDQRLLVEGDVRKFVTKVIGNLQARFPERPTTY